MKVVTRDEFAQILKNASIKPRLKRELRFVPEEITDWESRDFIAVTTKSGAEGIILAPLEVFYVVPFQLHKRTPNQFGRAEAVICDICATWQRGPYSAIISFPRETGSISYLCCADLLCSLHVRDKTSASKLSRTQLREIITTEDRTARLVSRLEQILKEVR